jgi:hypothetical protein
MQAYSFILVLFHEVYRKYSIIFLESPQILKERGKFDLGLSLCE